MKKHSNILFVIILVICSLFISACNNNNVMFKLENKYYDYNDEVPFSKLDTNDLEKLIKNKENFALFVYQPLCITSSDFEKILLEFMSTYKINFCKISFSDIKESSLGEKIKYYPSFVIFKKGEIVDYLESDKDEDIKIYKSSNEFKNWFTKYIEINEANLDNEQDNNVSNDEQEEEIDNIKELDMPNISKEENKVNIYFFWGDGCPHCEEETEFFNSIEEEYGKYYNLYKFETWNNEENAKIFKIFANAMNDEAKGVPYTIIGDKSFSGFLDSYKQDFIDAIEEQYKNNFDVYSDKIKK